MSYRHILRAAAISLVATLSLGCDKPNGAKIDNSKETSATAPGPALAATPAATEGLDAQAQDAAMAEVRKHWVKGPDGWTTALVGGSPYAPDHYLRQLHEITPANAEANELSDSDKMNGFEWAGKVYFRSSPGREAGDPGIAFEGMSSPTVNRQRGRWTQWVDFKPMPLHVQKVKGQWQVTRDNTLVGGTPPTPADYAKAGVK